MHRPDEFRTFCDIPVSNALGDAGDELADAVKCLSVDALSNDNDEDLAACLADRFAVEVPCLAFDAMTVEQSATMVPAEHFPKSFAVYPGKSYEKKTVIFRIPYRGDPKFLRCYDSTRSMNPARVFLEGSDVCFEVLSLSFDKVEIERGRDAAIQHLKRFLPPVAHAVQSFNQGLHGHALRLVRNRKKKIETDSDLLASLGTPVAAPSAPPATLAVPSPVKRRAIWIAETGAVSGGPPDPTLDERTYEDILSVLSDYGRQMERSPSTYRAMEEEDIRNNLLALIQACFQSGSATGESFNRSGKTDILLRYRNHNLFVAECKVWSGQKAFGNAITQLLGYLTWRDSKSAIVVFAKNKDMSRVLKAVRSAALAHPQFNEQDTHGTGLCRFRLGADLLGRRESRVVAHT